jgi:hypothetical protein
VLVARRALAVPPAPGGGLPAPSPVAASADSPLRPLRARFPLVGYPRVNGRGVASIRVRVPSAGRLAARATGSRNLAVDRTARRLRRAATVTVRLEPSRRVRRALARGRRVRVTARITFNPAAARSVSVTRRYTLTPRHAR